MSFYVNNILKRACHKIYHNKILCAGRGKDYEQAEILLKEAKVSMKRDLVIFSKLPPREINFSRGCLSSRTPGYPSEVIEPVNQMMVIKTLENKRK